MWVGKLNVTVSKKNADGGLYGRNTQRKALLVNLENLYNVVRAVKH